MRRTLVLAVTLATGIFLVSAGFNADAAEIRIVSAAVMKPVFDELTGEFERTTGHKLSIRYEPAGAARKRVEASDSIDIAILQKPAAEELARRGKINSQGMATFARSGIAVAVPRGMKKPDISTVESFKQALLAAKSVSYPDPAEGHAAGQLFRRIIERLGIAEQVDAKAKLQKRSFSESPPKDHADFAIAQPTEILLTPAYQLVDLIPDDLQDFERFSWTASVTTYAKEPNAAAALIRFLTSSKAALVMKRKGMEPGAL